MIVKEDFRAGAGERFEGACPICGEPEIARIEIDSEKIHVVASGLFFPPGQGFVQGRITAKVEHVGGRRCEGEVPADWKMP